MIVNAQRLIVVVSSLIFLLILLSDLLILIECKSETADGLTILRHVQLLFRHGDRTPVWVEPPEPYYDQKKYWPQGFGQLTRQGRAKAFRLGQLLRQHYQAYLDRRFLVREVYARSSAVDRCVETAQLIMAGAYPPNSTLARWDIDGYPLPLATIWQPSPIQTFIPSDDDTLLKVNKLCPEADQIKQLQLESKRNKRLLQRHRPLLDQVEKIVGRRLDSIIAVSDVHENLNIMHENGYYWYEWFQTNNVSCCLNWTQQTEEEATSKLRLFELAKYRSMFNDDFIKQVRAGELLQEIGERFRSKRSVHQPTIDDERDSRLVLYSSHDVKLTAILQTLNVWNEQLVPYLATMMFELHQSVGNSSKYYVQLWYYNQTSTLLNSTSLKLHRLDIPGCDHDELDEQELMCPLDDFLRLIQKYEPPEDWNHACGIHSPFTAMISVNILLLVVNLTMMFLLLMTIMYVCSCINHRPGYERLR